MKFTEADYYIEDILNEFEAIYDALYTRFLDHEPLDPAIHKLRTFEERYGNSYQSENAADDIKIGVFDDLGAIATKLIHKDSFSIEQIPLIKDILVTIARACTEEQCARATGEQIDDILAEINSVRA